MRVANWVLGGALAFSACSAYASVFTIDPSSFTSAPPGVTLSAMTLTQVSTDGPSATYEPSLGPVFSDGDHFASNTSDLWGFGGSLLYSMADCLEGCTEDLDNESGQWLRIDFQDPVNYVSALQLEHDVDTASEIIAFNSAGQVVGSCLGWVDEALSGTPSCATLPSDEYDAEGVTTNQLWLTESISDASEDISTVLIGDRDPNVGYNEVGTIQYGMVPEPATSGLAILGLLGLAWSQRRRSALTK